MLFLIALAAAACLAYFGSGALKKHPAVFYAAGAAVTAAVIIITQSDIRIQSQFVSKYLLGIFSRGALAGALWCIVMWAGAINGDTKAGKKLISKIMPSRGELSILAAVVTLAHAVSYGITYIKRFVLLTGKNIPLAWDFTATCLICIGLMAIMVPLTVMSVKAVRRKMNAKTWKNIQRAAYVFYALILAHILVLYIPQARNGDTERYISVLTYSAVFVGYAAMRLRKLYIRKKKPESRTACNAVAAAAGIAVFAVIAALSYGKAPTAPAVKETSSDTKAAVTTAADEKDHETVTTAVSTSEPEEGTTLTVTAQSTGSTSEGEEPEEETTTTAAETEEEEEQQSEEEPADEPNEDEPAPEAPGQEEQPAPQQQAEEKPEEPQYIYNNGTFTGHGTSVQYGGGVTAEVTVENDVITSVKVDFEVDDADYYETAKDYVIRQIKNSGSTDGIDTACGATHSADGIVEAVADALSQARR